MHKRWLEMTQRAMIVTWLIAAVTNSEAAALIVQTSERPSRRLAKLKVATSTLTT